MKHIVELPGPTIVNRPVHSMAVIVIILFAFHFARLAGFTAGAVSAALLVAVVAACSFGLRRSVSVDTTARTVKQTVTVFSITLHSRRMDLAAAAWAGVRSDLPDLVVEAGTSADDTIEILRFRNAYGRKESEVRAACSQLAAALQIEDRGHFYTGAATPRP